MYTGVVLGAATAVTTTAAVVMLPNTGGNILIDAAISLASGMIVWGIVYSRSR